MLEDVKGALRITSNDVQIKNEINDLIESARLDMVQSGVSNEIVKKEDDALIKRAIILYAKSNYGLDNKNADRFHQAYESLKMHLSYAGDYNGKLE